MIQRYDRQEGNKSPRSTKSKSYELFLSSGRENTIKKGIIKQLLEEGKSYTSRELCTILEIGIPSSICAPLYRLVEERLIEVTGTKIDPLTKRQVSLYSLSKNEEG